MSWRLAKSLERLREQVNDASDVFPDFALSDLVNGRMPNAEHLRECRPAHALGQKLSNSQHLGLRKFGCINVRPTSSAAHSNSVLHVLLTCHVFQIAKAIVKRVAVNVVDLESRRAGPDKRESDQPVNFKSPPCAVTGKLDGLISGASGIGTENAPCEGVCSGILSSDSPDVRDGIVPFIPNNREPCFILQFFNGKVFDSQDVNLHRQVSFWSGSLAAETACGPLVF